MPKPDLLMLTPMRPLVEAALEPHVTLHRLWEANDKDALIAEVGPRIRGIVSFVAPCPRSLIERLPALEIIATSAVGYDGIDVKAAAERGVVVTNTPDVLTDEVADLTIGLLLATLREIPRAEKYLRDGKWTEAPYRLTATLRGRSVGIVGLGRIGKAIAKRLEGFGVAIAYHGRREQPDVAYTYHPTLTGMAEAVDTLIAITPGGPETRHLINKETFEALGPDGVFINVARGSVVDQEALIAALKNGTILAAGLDVFENEPHVPAELIALENAVLLPHVASASIHTRDAMAQLAVDNIMAWLKDEPPLTPVPETPWPAKRS